MEYSFADLDKRDCLSGQARSTSTSAVMHNGAEVISSMFGGRSECAYLPWLAGDGC
jgi:hypothetical protein